MLRAWTDEEGEFYVIDRLEELRPWSRVRYNLRMLMFPWGTGSRASWQFHRYSQQAGMFMGVPTPDSARVDRDAREPNSSPWKNLALNFSRTWIINQEPSTLQLSVKCTWCAIFPKENSECWRACSSVPCFRIVASVLISDNPLDTLDCFYSSPSSRFGWIDSFRRKLKISNVKWESMKIVCERWFQ